MQKSILSISGIVVLGIIVLLINSIGDALFSRFYIDLTDEGLYSLSKGTKNIVSSLEEPITLRYYFSKTDSSKYPAVRLYGDRILDLLKQYERQSGGLINLEVFDPRPDSEEEEWAQKYGLTPLPLPTGGNLYFGLVAINSLGEEEIIALFDMRRQEFLEYDVTKVLYSLKTQEKPTVGIISALDISGKQAAQPQMPQMPMPPQEQPWILQSQLSNFADVRNLGTDVPEIPEEIDVLMVIHPKDLPEQTRYAIDQYVVSGRNLFVAVDPHAAVDQPQQDPSNPLARFAADRSSSLNSLLEKWGVTLEEKKVLGDLNLATKVSTQQGAAPIALPAWLTVGPAEEGQGGIVGGDDVITSSLETIMFPWPGALEVKDVEGLSHEVLFRTSNEASFFSENDIRFTGDDPQELLKNFRRGDKSYVLGVKIRGKFKSTFPGKPGADEEESAMSVEGGHIPEGQKPATVIVISDVDFLADRFAAVTQNLLGTRLVSLLNDNLIFAENAVENLSGSDDLISLRSRGQFSRPFTKVQQIEARAHERWQAEEERLQAKLQEANRRLSQLQANTGGNSGKVAFSQALLDEIQKYRDDRQEAQELLRQVRRNLREDKERLGAVLFAVNTFAVPLLLVVVSVAFFRKRMGKSKERAAAND